MSKILQQQDFRKEVLSKFKLRQKDVLNKYTLTVLQFTIFLLFIEVLPKKYAKFGPKSQSTTKHHMFRATNLHQSREFYTNAVGDVGDI